MQLQGCDGQHADAIRTALCLACRQPGGGMQAVGPGVAAAAVDSCAIECESQHNDLLNRPISAGLMACLQRTDNYSVQV
jgi:hypothetical protein